MSRRPLSSVALPPGMLAGLTRLGYETVQDVTDVSAELLSKEMAITIDAAENVLSSVKRHSNSDHISGSTPRQQTRPPTQAASFLMNAQQTVSTTYSPMDNLLCGGVRRGQVLEISGPPGSPKEALLLKVVSAFVELGEEVVFLETQNMVSPATIHKALRNLPPDCLRLVRFLRIHSLPDFMIFVHGLTLFLEAHPSTSLLVVNSISYLFQANPSMTASVKSMLLDQVKQTFTKACTLRQLTIVTTSQLATKMFKPDGSPGTFDDGARGIMQPALGSAYVPSVKSHKVIVIPESRTMGTLKLITSSAAAAAAQSYRWRNEELV
ncbi:hypothetical protein AX14_001275 [Amanita brunnescens Koide BX004]|nr:hypothetical protein AX14_001275 [Amanita brunnescens Koide BX004]